MPETWKKVYSCPVLEVYKGKIKFLGHLKRKNKEGCGRVEKKKSKAEVQATGREEWSHHKLGSSGRGRSVHRNETYILE